MNPAALEAADALEQSRRRLRSALMPPPRTAATGGRGPSPAWLLPLLTRLKAVPLAAVAVEALAGWWATHPLRAGAELGLGAARTIALPIARRNPVGLVLGSIVFGAAVVWSRPWRWLIRPALLAGLLPQIVAKVAAAVAQPPRSTVVKTGSVRLPPY